MRLATLLTLCLTLFCLGVGNQANATHIMGASITWDNIGKDSFEVKLKVYRDCTGIALRKPTLDIGCKNGSIGNINKTELSYNNGREVTPVCDKYGSQCGSNSQLGYGMQEHVVTYLVDLTNANCCKVKFSYKNCCRSNSITTGLDGEPYYVESWLDICKAPRNNSPKFRQLPLMLLCKDVAYRGNQGAFDKDTTASGTPSDSLSHNLAPPLGGPNDTLRYNNLYSKDYTYWRPLKFKGWPDTTVTGNLYGKFGFNLSDRTGHVAFHPIKVQTSVFKVHIKEFRDINGKPVQIGSYSRDVQVFVKRCPGNAAPRVQGFDCKTNSNFKRLCEGDQVNSTFCTKDGNAKDTITKFEFNPGNLPGNPQFSIKDPTARLPKGKLKWTVPQGSGGPKPYVFSLFAEDDHCPKAGEFAETFRVKVTPPPAKPTLNIDTLNCSKFRLSTTVSSPKTQLTVSVGGNKYQQDTFVFNPGENKLFPVKVTANRQGCKAFLRDTLDVNSKLVVDAGSDTTICYGSDLSLTPNVQFSNGSVSYTWQDSVTRKNRTFTGIRQDTTLWVQIEDSTCKATDVIHVSVDSFGQHVQTVSDTSVCKNGDKLITYADTQVSQYQWSTGSTGDSAVITAAGNYHVQLTNKRGCKGTDSFKVKERLKTDLVNDKATYCGPNSATLKANAGNPNATYQWSTGQTGKSIKVSTSGDYTVTASLDSGCQAIDTIKVLQAAGIKVGLGPDTAICKTDSVQLAANKGYADYSWGNGDTTRKTWASKQGYYTVTITNNRGCSSKDSLKVTTLNDCVWPGDANNDGVANNQDILQIGVKYNTSGKARNNQGTQWESYQVNDWSDSFASGLNTKFADCDGDGTVQTSDTQAVSQNYGLTHNKRGLEGRLKNGETPLSLKINQRNVQEGGKVKVDLEIGSATKPVENLYGIAANLTFNQELVKQDQVRVKSKGKMLQAVNPNFITFWKQFQASGRLELAATRTTTPGVYGQGVATTLILPLKDGISGDTLQVTLNGEYLIDSKGEPIAYDTGQTEVKQAITKSTGRAEHSRLSQHIQTYPNPTSDQLNVEVTQVDPQRARLLNARGQEIRTMDLNKGSNRLNVADLPAGPYHLMIRTAEGLVQQTVVVR